MQRASLQQLGSRFDTDEFASMNCAHELSPRLSRRQFRRCASSTRCWSAFWCICATSRRRSASSTPMPAPAATISPARRRRAAANGATASSGCRPRSIGEPARGAACALSRRGRRLQRPAAASPAIPARRRSCARSCARRTGCIACELEPNAAAALARNLRGDRRSKALAIDGWTALNAYVPPKERRGLVLIDPPFEDAGDFARLGAGARSRAPQMGERHLSAVVSDQGARASRTRWRGACGAVGIGKILRAELSLARDARRQPARAPAG